VYGALLALPFSDAFEDDIRAAVETTGLAGAAARGSENHSCSAAVTVAACVLERTGVAFACCAWVYVAVLDQSPR